MNEKQYLLVGFFRPSTFVPSFVTPLFRRKGEHFVQEIDDQANVFRLRLVDMEHFPYRVKPFASGIRVSANSLAIYGFALSRRNVVFMTKPQLSRILQARLQELVQYPFLYLDVLDFIREAESYRSSIYRVQNIIAAKNKELADRLTNRLLHDFQLEATPEGSIDWITEVLTLADPEGYINYWDVFDEIRNLIRLYGRVYIRCKLVRSVIGTNPKTRNTLKSMGFHSERIGRVSKELLLDLNTLQSLRSVNTYVLVTEVRVHAEEEILITACDTNAIQRRYYKKDERKVVRGKHHQDYLFQIVSI